MKRILLLKDVDTFFCIIYLDSKSSQICTTMPLFCWPRSTSNLSIFKSKTTKKSVHCPMPVNLFQEGIQCCEMQIYWIHLLMPRLTQTSESVRNRNLSTTLLAPFLYYRRVSCARQWSARRFKYSAWSITELEAVISSTDHSQCLYLPKESKSLLYIQNYGK